MKSLSENENNGGDNNNNDSFAKWLDFSLSPQMKMEGNNTSSPSSSNELQYNHYHNHHHHHHRRQGHDQTASVSTMSMLLSAQQQQQQQLSGANVCFQNNDGFLHTPLTVMPLKSDGSLCIMEALSRSQHSQVPKLEDFLGSGQERETMELSLESNVYYQQTSEQEESHRQQQQQQQHELFESYLSAMACQESLYKNWVNNGATVNNINSGGYVDHDVGSGVTLDVAPKHSALSCGELQSLSLSMSPGSQSSTVSAAAATTGTDCAPVNHMVKSKKRGLEMAGHEQVRPRKSIETFGQRTSQYRGVTKHRWTGRYEAHLWDNSCKKEGQTRKGRQVYLGGYDLEEKAARSYDLAALKYWGVQTHTNFSVENYKTEIEEMKNMTRQEFIAHLRRKSSGFSRGASIYRGVTRHHQHGRWQARIGRVAGNKDLYLGTFSTQEEAAEAYDVAAIKFRGLNAVTNFDIGRYDVEAIIGSHILLAGDQAKRNNTGRIEQNPSAENATGQIKMVSYHDSQTFMNSNNGGDHYPNNPNPWFSLALQDLVGHDSTKLSSSSAHFSNASSLVTSLNSSREVSPDRNGSPPLSSSATVPSKSLQLASGFVNQANVVSPWLASGEVIRPAVAHLPVFAAWGSDA